MKTRLKILIALAFLTIGVANAQVGIGTTNPKGALDITSTTNGLLVPRMNSSERDAIATPANALLIFNTSNNSFEVYKTTCTCWVTVADGGNIPANNFVNTPPTASALNYTGDFRNGGTATIVYTYEDAQGDAEGVTTLQWEIANDAVGNGKTNLSTGASATFGPTNVGRFVRIKVTPRAATGVLNGIAYYGAWMQVVGATIPYGSALSVTGTVAQGSELTGVYTFNGGSGIENALGSTYIWQSAINNVGSGIQSIGDSRTLIPLSNVIGRYIRFGVRATDNASLSATNFVYSNWVGPVTLAAEAKPVASNVNFSPPSPGSNVMLTATYTYADANDDPEGTSTYQWYTADDATGTNQTPIAGATAATFTVTNTQATKYIGFGVTPIATTGNTTGTEVVYYDPAPSVSTGTFTFTSAAQKSNNFYVGRVMNGTDAISVTINVTFPGSISFSSTTVNGYSFSGGGTYTAGAHTVTLTAAGTQSAYNIGGDTFTITGLGTNTETAIFQVANVSIGTGFTTHYNGITAGVSVNHLLATYTTGETFNNNGTCVSKPISASACSGSTITIGGNTYSIANINGQCWMTQNLKELPNGVAVNATQWLVSSPGDLGYYGYFNTITVNGSAGWGTTEPASGEGLLYQWSAAMLGSTTERARGVCPAGWHVPSDCEWMYLEHGQGMALAQQTLGNSWRSNSTDNQGTPGYKLRSAGLGQTNASGFSALLVGYRDTAGTFDFRTSYSGFWTSSAATTTTSTSRSFNAGNRGVGRNSTNSAAGFSVRCLKD